MVKGVPRGASPPPGDCAALLPRLPRAPTLPRCLWAWPQRQGCLPMVLSFWGARRPPLPQMRRTIRAGSECSVLSDLLTREVPGHHLHFTGLPAAGCRPGWQEPSTPHPPTVELTPTPCTLFAELTLVPRTLRLQRFPWRPVPSIHRAHPGALHPLSAGFLAPHTLHPQGSPGTLHPPSAGLAPAPRTLRLQGSPWHPTPSIHRARLAPRTLRLQDLPWHPAPSICRAHSGALHPPSAGVTLVPRALHL